MGRQTPNPLALFPHTKTTMRLTVNKLRIKAKKLKYTLVVSTGKYKYTLYYGTGKKRIIAQISNRIEPLFEHLETIEKVRYLQSLSTIQLFRLLCFMVFKNKPLAWWCWWLL